MSNRKYKVFFQLLTYQSQENLSVGKLPLYKWIKQQSTVEWFFFSVSMLNLYNNQKYKYHVLYNGQEERAGGKSHHERCQIQGWGSFSSLCPISKHSKTALPSSASFLTLLCSFPLKNLWVFFNLLFSLSFLYLLYKALFQGV